MASGAGFDDCVEARDWQPAEINLLRAAATANIGGGLDIDTTSGIGCDIQQWGTLTISGAGARAERLTALHHLFARATVGEISDAELEACGIGTDMIRVSIGIEEADDILWDLEQALEKSQRADAARAATVTEEAAGHSLMSKAFGAPFQR